MTIISTLFCFHSAGAIGRSTPQRLDHPCPKADVQYGGKDQMEHYSVQTEPIGEVLSITVCIRHRTLTDDWYLRYIIVGDAQGRQVRNFPCHSQITGKVTLRPGDGEYPAAVCIYFKQ